MNDILRTIISAKRERVNQLMSSITVDDLVISAKASRAQRPSNLLAKALADRSRVNIIAEFKRASPSKGVINDTRGVAEAIRAYETGGAAAISVLTEEEFFHGSPDDLIKARQETLLPILMKDFVVDAFQIHSAAAAGADAILLIAAALDDLQLIEFRELAESYGMDAIVEVHDVNEMERAERSRANIIGVNNRDLRTFNVSLETSRALAAKRTKAALLVSESGLSEPGDLVSLMRMGFNGFLIGEALMQSGSPADELMRFVSAAPHADRAVSGEVPQ